MSTLADLFDDSHSVVDDATPAAINGPEASQALEVLIGGRRAGGVQTDVVDDAERLLAMVDAAAETAGPVVMPAEFAAGSHGFGASGRRGSRSSRGRKRTDWVSVVAAAVAVVVVAGAVAIAGAQAANAGPAAGAMKSLIVDEAELANATIAVTTARDRVEASIAAGIAEADELDPALAAVSGYVDEGRRTAAVASVAAYRTGLEAVEVPPAPAPYTREVADPDSLPDVAAAIDTVQQLMMDIADQTTLVRAARDEVAALEAAFRPQITEFGLSFPLEAAAAVEAAPDAEQTLMDAVIAAGNAVPERQAAGFSGASEMMAYPAPVDALRADQQRVDEIVEERRRAAEQAAEEAAAEEARRRAYTPPVEQPAPVEPTPPAEPPADGTVTP